MFGPVHSIVLTLCVAAPALGGTPAGPARLGDSYELAPPAARPPVVLRFVPHRDPKAGNRVIAVNTSKETVFVTIKQTWKDGFERRTYTKEYKLLAGQEREVGTTGFIKPRRFEITGTR